MNHCRPTKEEGAFNPLPPLHARVSLGSVHLARPVLGPLLTTTTGLLPPECPALRPLGSRDRSSAHNLGQAATLAPTSLSFWKAHHELIEIVNADFCGLKTSAPFCLLCGFFSFSFSFFFFFFVNVWLFIKWQDVQ